LNIAVALQFRFHGVLTLAAFWDLSDQRQQHFEARVLTTASFWAQKSAPNFDNRAAALVSEEIVGI
jgi:hypothetical protein